MIKSLRKIKERLIVEGNLKRYLIYAIGEIILVVAGILIALSLNNWNDNRKERQLENKILKEIESNLKQDLAEIRDDISHMDSIYKACNNIISFIKSSDTPSDDLYFNAAMLRVTPHFDPNKSGYALLVSHGVGIIQNDSLRKAISVLYESTYSYYYRYEQERIEFKTHFIQPKLVDYFTMIIRNDRKYMGEFQITPADYKHMRENDSFAKLINSIAYENNGVLVRAARIEKSISALLNLLKRDPGN